MKKNYLLMLTIFGAGLLVVSAGGIGSFPERSGYHPGFDTPSAKIISHNEYLTEAEIVFTSHLCSLLTELEGEMTAGVKDDPPVTVAIAIIDTGIDPAHPELMARLLPGYNFRSRNGDTADRNGHGTMVAGVAVLSSGIACGSGLDGRIMLMPLVAANAKGETTSGILAEAIRYAADHDARIINVSYGGIADRRILQEAADYAWSKGAVIFAAAMNDFHGHPSFPAACDHVVAVTGLGLNDYRASFANYGDWIDLAADGTWVPTTSRGGGYALVNGTSFAAPATAGLGALLLLAKPELSNAELVDILTGSAQDLGSPGFDPNYGFGRVDPAGSIEALRTENLKKGQPGKERGENRPGYKKRAQKEAP